MNALRISKPLLAGMVVLLLMSCVSGGSREHHTAGKGEKARQMETHPIVLVHGFLGFDAETIIKFPYWGGTVDLEAELRDEGFPVYTAAVGPISSNWDRACELYAFIRGGRVDYGASHADRYGHARFGREFPGIFPQAGEIPSGAEEIGRVHLIGHSMGGQTARLLVELLENGDPEERAYQQEDRSPLFDGGHSLVKSVTTISTPHDGTTLVYDFERMGFLEKIMFRLLATMSLNREEPALDLMIEHWKPVKNTDESFESFVRRAIRDELWHNTEDFCFYDLSPEGAAELNRRVYASPEVYFFSWSTSRTEAGEEKGHHTPLPGMNLPLIGNAKYMGSLEELPSICGADPSLWWESDGIVNTCSMDGPTLDSADRIVPSSMDIDTPEKGVWNFMGTLKPLDHWQIHIVPPIGGHAPPGYTTLTDFYLQWCRYLQNLPE